MNFYLSRDAVAGVAVVVDPLPPDPERFCALVGGPTDKPLAILFRQVATPNYELRRFLRLSRRLGLEPMILQYHSDLMSCHNAFKRSLIHPSFIRGIGRDGRPYHTRRPMIRMELADNLPLCDIVVAGRPLPEFHNEVLRQALQGISLRLVEGSHWFDRYVAGARDYYVDLFCGLTRGAVLFEDFTTDSSERRFFSEVVRPAFDTAASIVGRFPAVARLCPNRRMASPLWYAYPETYWPIFQDLGAAL